MDPLDEPASERNDHTLTLILALIISGIGAALAIGLIAGLLGWMPPNCASYSTNRTGRCNADDAELTVTPPVIPTFNASRMRIVEPPPGCIQPADVAGAATELARCMPLDARAADFEKTLADWKFVRPATAEQPLGIGGAVEADVLPGGAAEVLLDFYPDPDRFWDPLGRFVVFQRGAAWTIASDAAGLPGHTPLDAPWSSWSWKVAQTADISGDGLSEILLKRFWNNGHNAYFAEWLVLSAEGGAGLRPAWQEDEPHALAVYGLDPAGRGVTVTHPVGAFPGRQISRRFRWDGAGLAQTERKIDPPTEAVASLVRADAALAAGDEAGVRAGLALAGKVFSYSAGQSPVMDDESVLAEWALLRFAQWEMAHRGGDPDRVRMDLATLEFFRNAARARADTPGRGKLLDTFVNATLPFSDPAATRRAGCAAVAALAAREPETLAALAEASRGGLTYTAATACVGR